METHDLKKTKDQQKSLIGTIHTGCRDGLLNRQ